MRTHLVALAAVLCLTMAVAAGELDREFKGSDVNRPTAAPSALVDTASKELSATELDGESPTQAWHRWGWGWGRGYGWGWHGGWGLRVGFGWGGWRGWGLGYGWHRPYYGGFYGGLGYWPSYYYRPYYPFAYSYYPSYLAYGYRGWGHCCW